MDISYDVQWVVYVGVLCMHVYYESECMEVRYLCVLLVG